MAVQESTVGGDGNFRLAVLDPTVQRLDREPAVDDRVDRADPGARQHRDHDLRDARQIDRDAVAFAHAYASQDIGELAHLAMEREVRVGARLAILALPDQRQFVAPPRLLMPVERVVDSVSLRRVCSRNKHRLRAFVRGGDEFSEPSLLPSQCSRYLAGISLPPRHDGRITRHRVT